MNDLGVCPACGEAIQGGYCQDCGPVRPGEDTSFRVREVRPDYRPRWRFIVRYSYPDQGESTRAVESRAESLDDVLAALEDFLKAAGFNLDGHLDVVPLDE